MNTPMQEMLEWVRATLPMDLDTPRLIEQKIESMLEKEQQVMCEFAIDYTMQTKTAYDFHRAKFNNEL